MFCSPSCQWFASCCRLVASNTSVLLSDMSTVCLLLHAYVGRTCCCCCLLLSVKTALSWKGINKHGVIRQEPARCAVVLARVLPGVCRLRHSCCCHFPQRVAFAAGLCSWTFCAAVTLVNGLLSGAGLCGWSFCQWFSLSCRFVQYGMCAG